MLLLVSFTNYSQNIYKKYTDFAFKQTNVLHNLIDYSEKLSKKQQDKFHSEFYAIFYYLTTPQFANERYAFQVNMLYYGEDDLSKRKTKQQVKKEVGIFIEKKEISKFAAYQLQLLDVVLNGTTIKDNTPSVIKNVIESFKKEYIILKQLEKI